MGKQNRGNSRTPRDTGRDSGDDGFETNSDVESDERIGAGQPLLPIVNDDGSSADDEGDDSLDTSFNGPLEPLIPQVENSDTGREPEFRDDRRDDHDRLMFDRETEERDYTEEERLELFKLTLFQNHLPTLPKIPGQHACWLTTTNPRDSIHGRQRLGYRLLRTSEVPGFEHSEIREGPYAGCIGVNEMVAAVLPLRLYRMYMNEAHHNQPLQEEQRIRSTLESHADAARSVKGKVMETESMREIGKSRRPRFSDVG